ncbi:MAG: hypothetical protein JW771_04510 [Candidatus Thermoplasmatota archaeon]|nr:hypothetical protein [Candidatus Thermoplasmatota archaeon]
MKRKTTISIVLALLMVITTFTVAPVNAEECDSIEVTKKVWNEQTETWVPELDGAVVGDLILFNITITYHNYNPCCPNNYAYNFSVHDVLPEGLTYVQTETPRNPDEIQGENIYWNFSDEEITLKDGESFSIVFEVVAMEYDEFVNYVEATSNDFCQGGELYDYGQATVNVEPGIDVEKTVWDPDQEQWVDHLDSVIKAKDVRFQIEITYYGPGILTCMEVYDTFQGECDCLEYKGNEEFFYPNDELFDDPAINIHSNLKVVEFIWRSDLGKLFNLKDHESIIIQFDADVIDYCYCGEGYDIVTNYAGVFGCNCADCECESRYEGQDTATVSCQPHDPVFEKTVAYKEGGKIFWVDETTARIGDIVTFKVELTYYGSYNLTDIIITDYLPKNILEYANEAALIVYRYNETAAWVVTYEPFEGDVSEDQTVVTFTIPTSLNDNEGLKITFDAEVVGLTGDCEECGVNIAEFVGVESETQDEYSGSDEAMVKTFEKVPIDLCLGVKRLNMGKINAYIANNGADDLADVAWTLTVTGGLLKRINIYDEGTVDIPSGIVISLSTPARSIVRKFGRVHVTLTAEVDGETFNKTMNGFAFGRIILIRPLIRR